MLNEMTQLINSVGLGCSHMPTRKKSMVTTGSTNSPFEIFYGKKPKIVGLFSGFGRIAYITKQGEIKTQIMDKMYKTIMVG